MGKRILGVILAAVMVGSLLGSGGVTTAYAEETAAAEEVSDGEASGDEEAYENSETPEDEEASADEETSTGEAADSSEETGTEEGQMQSGGEETVSEADGESEAEETTEEESATEDGSLEDEDTAAETGSSGGEIAVVSGGVSDEILEEEAAAAEAAASSEEDGTDDSYDVSTYAGLTSAVSNIASSDSKTGSIVITDDFTVSSEVTIPSGADITIIDDGEAHTITVKYSSGAGFTVESGGKLTIDGKDLTFTQGASNNTYPILLVQGESELKNGVLTNNNVKLKSGSNSSSKTGYGGVVQVAGSSASFVMSGGTIMNATATGNYTGLVVVRDGASFEMSGGSITGFSSTTSYYSSAVLVFAYNADASFTMSGGTITSNSSYSGGGVNVYANNTYTASFTMTGGTISKNTASLYGGGIYFGANSSGATASVTISGGTISGNTALLYGGGIACAVFNGTFIGNINLTIEGGKITQNSANESGGGLYAGSGDDSDVAVVLRGGSFEKNIAGEYGGGMYLGGTSATIDGAVISGNSAVTGGGIYAVCDTYIYSGEIKNNKTTAEKSDADEGHGGGIYVGYGHTLYLYNVIITENTASVLGGGIWACNTGYIRVYVTEGGAVYENDAQDSGGSKDSSQAGDDIASVGRDEEYILYLSNRILGGGSATWYEDGAVDTSIHPGAGDADSSASRYDNEDEHAKASTTMTTSASYALHDEASSTNLAEKIATTIISGNSALRGGGIATNGSVIIGTDEYTSLTVTKVWEDADNANSTRPNSITVYLYNTVTTIDNNGTETTKKYLIDKATLTSDDVSADDSNIWICTFEGLPVEGEYSYVIEEEDVEGYETAYSAVTGSASDGYEVTVTNTYRGWGSIMVSKTVSGTAASTTKKFTFTMSLSDSSINGTYGDVTFTDGVATFELKADESVTIPDLPAGVEYKVVESGNSGYTVTSRNTKGTVEADETITVTFNNHKDKASGTTSVSSAQTGDPADATLWIALAAAAVAAGASVTMQYQKRRKE